MRILIGVGASPSAAIACRFVANRTWPAGTTVELVATEDIPDALLAERAASVRRPALSVVTTREPGPAAEAILRVAASSFAQLIVVGSRGLGPVASAVRGSVSAHLVDHAPCPVLVARAPDATRMLVATDGTDGSRVIPRVLAWWGEAFRGLPVEVLSVAPRLVLFSRGGPVSDRQHLEDPRHELVARQVAAELSDLGWQTTATVRSGDPEREILAEAALWDADLIVTGSRGLGSLRRMVLGSVSHDILLRSTASVLVMRGNVPAPIGHRIDREATSFA